MTTYPNCKINLGLHVVGRRPDGYHDLETIFVPVTDLCDELTIAELDAPTPRMEQTGLSLDNTPENNICLRAWRLLHDEYDIPPVLIQLTKHIPFGAGLGGGSSDAAFTLKMLNEMFSIGLGTAVLERHAARLGADCAFFIRNHAAYATGIGDQLEPLPEFRIQNSEFRIEIEIPEGEHVSTKEAYAGLHPTGGLINSEVGGRRSEGSEFRIPNSDLNCDLREAVRRPVEEWRHLIVNDFEASVFPAHPAIAALKADMYNRGALYASMTGSGAAVFGIFRK